MSNKKSNNKLEFEYCVKLTGEELEILKDRLIKFCVHCETIKLPRSHHCRQCNRCVVRMDHHCPWIGTCVGLRNQKAFLLFIFYVLQLSLLHTCSFMWEGIICAVIINTKCHFYKIDQEWKIVDEVLIILTLFFSTGFAFFTFVMLAD